MSEAGYQVYVSCMQAENAQLRCMYLAGAQDAATHHAALVGTLVLLLVILATVAVGSLVLLGSVFVKYQRAIGHYW